jgi:hypothetical protein
LEYIDADTVIRRYYRINRGNNRVEGVDTRMPGFTPNVSLRAVF